MPDSPALLVDLLRLDPPEQNQHPAAMSPAQWSGLLAAAPGYLHPYLAHRISGRFPRGEVPSHVMRQLDLARRSAALGQLQRQALLRRLLPALEAAGVPILVLKGAALGWLAYPDPALRPMDDIDLWTPPDQLERAARVILDAGLRYPERREARKAAADRPEAASTRVFESADGRLVVELHGELHSLAAFSAGWIRQAWDRSETVDLGGIRARTLGPEEMLTHLAIHTSAYHRFETGLRSLLDISLWLQRTGARYDWPRMRQVWERERCSTWMYLTLALARELLGAPVPERYFELSPRPAGLADLRELARAQVLAGTRTLPPALTHLAAAHSAGEGASWLVQRLTSWYWRGPPGESRALGQILAQAGERMAHDLRHKLPPYVRGMVDGSFRGEEYRARKALAVARRRLAELVEREEAGRGERPPGAESEPLSPRAAP